MAQVQCPNGHFYNNEIYSKCPYCRSQPPPPPPPPPPEGHDWKSIAIKVAAAVCAVVAIGSFGYAQSIEANLSNAKNDQKKITQDFHSKTKEMDTKGSSLNESKNRLATLKSFFGSYDKYFYADVPVLVLNSGGETKRLNIHGSLYAVTWLEDYAENAFTSHCATDIVAEWSENSGIKVTSGSTKGFKGCLHKIICPN